MNNDFKNPETEKKLKAYARSVGRSVEDVRAEMLEIINSFPLVFDLDPATNFQKVVELFQAIPWERIRALKPKIIAEEYPRRADWKDADVLNHLFEKGLLNLELKLSEKN